MKLISILTVVLVSTVTSLSTQAASYSISGQITVCPGVCSIFTSVGESALFTFDGADDAGDNISITNTHIYLSTFFGGPIAFFGDSAVDSTLTADASNHLLGGSVTLPVTNYNGLSLQGVIDIDSGTWAAFIVSDADGHLDPLASGSLSAVPVPAAAWLFGSSLIGLGALVRRKA